MDRDYYLNRPTWFVADIMNLVHNEWYQAFCPYDEFTNNYCICGA